MNEWTGVLAHLDQPTQDDRVLAAPERLLSRPLPLPITALDGRIAGAITRLAIHGDEVRAEGTVRDGILTPERPELPIALDADETTWHHDGPDRLVFDTWRITGATLLTDPTSAPWPDSMIRLKEDGRD
jgi:hypothetical protein